MAYSYSGSFGDSQFIPCGLTLLAEIKQCVDLGLLDVTNLGQIGDARHQAEPTSRHNPAKAPDGVWYVCAADFGGKDYRKLAEFHQARYRAHDPRVYPYGFCQFGDGYGLSWLDGGQKWTGRDQGHAHLDFTMKRPALTSDWWVPALADTSPWGLEDWLRGGTTTAPTETVKVDDDMAKLGQTPDGRLWKYDGIWRTWVQRGKWPQVAFARVRDGQDLTVQPFAYEDADACMGIDTGMIAPRKAD